MKFPSLFYFCLPFFALTCDLLVIHFYGSNLLHITFLSFIFAALQGSSYFFITPLLCVSLLSLISYDSLFLIPLFALPLIIIMQIADQYLRSKQITSLIFYLIYVTIFLWILPLFSLNTNPFTPCTFWAFTGNIIIASLSLKLLPIVE